MSKIGIPIIFLFSLLIALGCNRIKCEGTYKVEAEVTDNGLNVRDRMISGKVIAVLKKGDKVEIVKRTTTKYKVQSYHNYWYEIELQSGTTGWCYGQWLRISGFDSFEAGLMEYAGQGDICWVKYLVRLGADVKAKDHFKRTAIMYAMGKIGYETQLKKTYFNELIDFLKGQGAVVPDLSLIDAVKQGDIDKVKQLLKQGHDINAVDYDTKTPLICAVEKNKYDIAKLLVEKGANVNALFLLEPNNEMSIVEIAIETNNFELVKLLVKNGAKLNAVIRGGYTPLMRATSKNNFEMVKLLVRYKANINDKLEVGPCDTALNFAIFNNNIKIVKFLISKGINLNYLSGRPHFNTTPLGWAKNYKRKEIIKILIDAGAIEKTYSNPN